MSNFVHIPQFGGMPAPMSATGTDQQFELGLEVWARDMGQTSPVSTLAATATAPTLGGGLFRYVRGSDVGTAGLVVYISNDSAVKLGAAQNAPVGIAAGALSATNVFGWVQIQGKCDYARGTGVALTSGNPLYVGTAAGFVVSGSVAGSQIRNMSCYANYTSSQSLSMSLQLERPWVYSTGASI